VADRKGFNQGCVVVLLWNFAFWLALGVFAWWLIGRL
jgi:hypothetical protein